MSQVQIGIDGFHILPRWQRFEHRVRGGADSSLNAASAYLLARLWHRRLDVAEADCGMCGFVCWVVLSGSGLWILRLRGWLRR